MDLSAKIEYALQEALKTGTRNGDASALKAALDANQDLIRKAIAQGHTATGLAKTLKAAGISASVETLEQHLKSSYEDKGDGGSERSQSVYESSESGECGQP